MNNKHPIILKQTPVACLLILFRGD